MPGYEGFPIYDFKSGLEIDKESWLLPKDAFKKLKNAFVQRGVLQKRKGYSVWGRFVNAKTAEALGTTVDLQLTYNGTLANGPLRPGDLTILTSGGGETFNDNGNGTLTGTGTPAGSGTINYTTKVWSITYGSNPGAGKSITANYDYFPNLPIMGITTYYTDAGSSHLLVFNTKRVNKYDPVTFKLEDIVGSDIFTGSDSDFFWFENWMDRLFITNNVDRVKIYNGSTIENLLIDYDGDEANDVDTCLLIFSYKGHLVLLRTTEKGIHAPHKARSSVANSYTNWKESEGGAYVNCPSIDWIMGGDFIGDDLIVTMERSIWALKYIGDPNLPFRWESVKSTEGNYATHSLAAFTDELIFLGPVQLIATDGLDVYGIDQKIPDFTLNFDNEGFKYCNATVIEELRQYLLSYPSIGASHSDHILILNYEEKTFANFAMPIHCFGYYQQGEDLTWDDVESTWDEIEWSWDEKALQAGYPITLGGSYDGYIFKMNDGGSDNGANIELDIESGHWNPYVEQGRQARLGWIDFLVDRDPNVLADIEFFLDHRTTPYQTKSLVCDGEGDKVWKRIYSGAIGSFHRIRFHHNAIAQTLKVHAVVPYFKSEGAII